MSSLEELQAASETFVAETLSQIQDLLNVQLEDFKRMHRESYSGMIESLYKLIETKVKKPFAIVMTDEFTENAGGEMAAKKICGNGYAIESPLTMLTAANVELLVSTSVRITSRFAEKLRAKFCRYKVNDVTKIALDLIAAGEPFPVDKMGSKITWTRPKARGYSMRALSYDRELFVRHACIIHDQKYDYDKVTCIGSENIIILCVAHGEFSQTPQIHLSGEGCPDCRKRALKTHRYYVHKLKSSYSGRIVMDCEDISLLKTRTVGVHKRKFIPVRCTVHDYKFEREIGHLFKFDGGCMKCRSEKLTQLQTRPWDEVKLELEEKHSGIYDYSRSDYQNMETKMQIYCKTCKRFFRQTPAMHRVGKGCPTCKDSGGEKAVRLCLEQDNIEYFREYRYLNTSIASMFVDFRIITPRGHEAVIEFDGDFHFVHHFTGKGHLDKQQQRDAMKDQYMIDNRISMLRIHIDDARIRKSVTSVDHQLVFGFVREFIAKVDAEGYARVYTESYPEKLRRY